MTFENCEISNNTASYFGGAGYLDEGSSTSTLTMDGTLMSDNTAAIGGGLFIEEDSVVSCTGTTSTSAGFLNNTAEIQGGAIFFYDFDNTASIESDTCDFGTSAGGDDNSSYEGSSNDIYYYEGDRFAYGDDESFSCSNESCD
ncbi:MAG: putative outer membrane repeat protein [Myxococcota bacterium]|jgi:predicted outer membrane repeat protein